MKERKTFHAHLKELSSMLMWLRGKLAMTMLAERHQKSVELACEEVLVNAIVHGYKGRGGEIWLEWRSFEDRLEIEVCDCGPPFNPLSHPIDYDVTAPLEERKEGGLGLFFLKACVDDLHYERRGDWNALILIKRFSQTP